jgi:ATP-dependent helicase/nuclease subunit B
VSLGHPLANWPLVTDALAVLHLGERQLTQPEAVRLLRSPFLPGWDAEHLARDRAAGHLASRAPYDLTPNELHWAAAQAGADTLAAALTRWQSQRRGPSGVASPSEWAARFQMELTSLGFGSGRSLDSREYQVLQRWHDLLEAFSALDVVVGPPIARADALALLAERAGGVVFREQNPGVPVEVLGVEEALGSRFDALWITTLDSDTWPGPTRRDPLIPAPVQARVPRATSAGCLAQARLEIEALLACADTVCGSFARGTEAEEIQVTALLPESPVQRLDGAGIPEQAALAEPIDDTQAPPLASGEIRGGTGLLQNQCDCPFRAFAQRRLGAREWTPPRPGLSAAQRGTVIHAALEHFWSGLSGRAELVAQGEDALRARIAAAVTAALNAFTERYRLILTAAGRRLEQWRTERVLERWLGEVESRRGDFTVAAREQEVTLRVGDLTLSGKIDRIDRLPDGGTLLIDYKTGTNGKSAWAPADFADPQLPAYALAMDPQPVGIAFARLRPDDLRFDGLADADVGTAGINPIGAAKGKFDDIDTWPELLDAWASRLAALAEDFAAGRAAVAPRTAKVCTHCHLHALCRVHERAPEALFEDDADDADDAADRADG